MKRFSLFAANLAGTAVLADLVRYLQASTVTRLLILLIVIAIIAYFCWSGGKDEKSGCFYVFVGASLTIMDLLILTEHSSLMSYTAEIIVLFFGSRITGDNLRLFDSVVTSFATAGTGGFSVLNSSILGYNSKFVEWVCIIFMFLFGVNFNLYYFLLTKRYKEAFMDEEFRTYVIINVTFVALITLNIMGTYPHISDAIRDSFFAVNTCMSTTGFGTADFDLWPTFSKIILLLAMCIGCSAGSTGGGIKVSRVVLYTKQIFRDLRLSTRPNTIIKVRMNKRVVDDKVIRGVNVYLIIYVSITVISTLLLSIEGYSITTCFSGVVACFNNIGPGLELLGPTKNFDFLSMGSKIVLIIDMLAGRLELFPIIVLFSPNTWRKAK